MLKILCSAMLGLASSALAAPAPPFPLAPLSYREQEPYSGAGCVVERNGRVVFISDFVGGAVRYKGKLATLVHVRNKRLDLPFSMTDKEIYMGEVNGDFVLAFVPWGKITTDIENEMQIRSMTMVIVDDRPSTQVPVVMKCGG